MFRIGEDVFTEPRKDTDIDLVAEVTQIFQDMGHVCPTAWLNAPLISQAIDQAPKLQRFLINRYWRLVLGKLKENTTRQRYCLKQEGSDKEYLELFRDELAPFIVKRNL